LNLLLAGARRISLDVESMKPDQLSAAPPAEDRRDNVVKKLSLQAHLEARQLEDVQRDLAQRL